MEGVKLGSVMYSSFSEHWIAITLKIHFILCDSADSR